MATDAAKVEILYLKSLGITTAQSGVSAGGQPSLGEVSRVGVLPSQVFVSAVPSTAPTDMVKADPQPANADVDIGAGDLYGRYASSSSPWVARYWRMNLKLSIAGAAPAYWTNSATIGTGVGNLLTRCIPGTLDAAGGYAPRVYVGRTFVPSASPTSPWILDYDGGVLRFPSGLGGADPASAVTITFWRYEGQVLSEVTLGATTSIAAIVDIGSAGTAVALTVPQAGKILSVLADTAAYDLTLPVAGLSVGSVFMMSLRPESTYAVTVKTGGGATLATLSVIAPRLGLVWTGTAWRSF